jgi:hypothetical protein
MSAIPIQHLPAPAAARAPLLRIVAPIDREAIGVAGATPIEQRHRLPVAMQVRIIDAVHRMKLEEA